MLSLPSSGADCRISAVQTRQGQRCPSAAAAESAAAPSLGLPTRPRNSELHSFPSPSCVSVCHAKFHPIYVLFPLWREPGATAESAGPPRRRRRGRWRVQCRRRQRLWREVNFSSNNSLNRVAHYYTFKTYAIGFTQSCYVRVKIRFHPKLLDWQKAE